jgi:hypothetical protein
MTTGDQLTFYSGWMAGSRGAVQNFINARNYDIDIYDEDGALVFHLGGKNVRNYWEWVEPTEEEIAAWRGVAPAMKSGPALAMWFVPVPPLPVGTYTVDTEFGTAHTVTDLGDFYDRFGNEIPDHKPDKYPPFLLSGTSSFSLVVTP